MIKRCQYCRFECNQSCQRHAPVFDKERSCKHSFPYCPDYPNDFCGDFVQKDTITWNPETHEWDLNQ
jgi:hypothetical protein